MAAKREQIGIGFPFLLACPSFKSPSPPFLLPFHENSTEVASGGEEDRREGEGEGTLLLVAVFRPCQTY